MIHSGWQVRAHSGQICKFTRTARSSHCSDAAGMRTRRACRCGDGGERRGEREDGAPAVALWQEQRLLRRRGVKCDRIVR